MKALSLVLMVFTTQFVLADTMDSLLQKGNEYYIAKDYYKAARYYETILKAGKESADLYDNLGNVYYKLNDISRSILYYEKAIQLNPDFQDAIFNLSIVNTRTTDKIEQMPDIFFIAWFKSVRNWMSPDSWAIFALAIFLILLTVVLLILLVPSLLIRRIAFASSFLFLLLFIFTFVFAYSAYKAAVSDDQAIVMSPSVIVKSSPDETATDLFMIHEGTKVKINEAFGDWIEIQLADGKSGWITALNVEVI
jgi:tetratricopeptide (TPR) repeat protein